MASDTLPKELLAGYRQFMDGRYSHEQQRYLDLAKEGQQPKTLVVGCCDSRAAPETIFNCGPGELFVVRNVANLVPPYAPDGQFHATSAALEFAVQALQVENIVVMGHGQCGGIKAALATDMAPLSPGDFIGKWMSLLEPLADSLKVGSAMDAAERQTALERVSIRNSIGNLMSFPYIRKRVEDGSLNLFGAWFDIGLGELWIMNKKTGDFFRVEREEAQA